MEKTIYTVLTALNFHFFFIFVSSKKTFLCMVPWQQELFWCFFSDRPKVFMRWVLRTFDVPIFKLGKYNFFIHDWIMQAFENSPIILTAGEKSNVKNACENTLRSQSVRVVGTCTGMSWDQSLHNYKVMQPQGWTLWISGMDVMDAGWYAWVHSTGFVNWVVLLLHPGNFKSFPSNRQYTGFQNQTNCNPHPYKQ